MWKHPPPQWLLTSLPQSTSRRSPPFFQKRLDNKQMFRQHVKHYHQWLWVDNKSGEIRTETYSSVFGRGLRMRSRFGHCKSHSREMAQTSGFDPATQVKICFGCKMFDVANWVACLNRENGPRGTLSHEALSVSPQGALEISSVVGHTPYLDRNHFSTHRVVAESHKRDERCRPSSQRPQYPILCRHLKRRLGCLLRANLYKRSVVKQGKKATHKCYRAEGGFSGPSKVQGPVSKPNSIGCYGQLNSSILHKQTRKLTRRRYALSCGRSWPGAIITR